MMMMIRRRRRRRRPQKHQHQHSGNNNNNNRIRRNRRTTLLIRQQQQRPPVLLLLLLLLLSLLLALLLQQQQPGSAAAAAEIEVGQDGTTTPQPLGDIATRLLKDSESTLTSKQASDVAAYIDQLSKDKETKQLLSKMKDGSGKELFANFVTDDMKTPKQLTQSMYASYKVLKVVDEIFNDLSSSEDTFLELVKEDLIDQKMIEAYSDDTSQLERDTKMAVQFKFIAVSAAGGYL